jgi:hypothetical protein
MGINFNNRIVEFWKWFESISDELLLNPNREDLISQIDVHINQLGAFDWEIGPLSKITSYFAISPNLDYDKLQYTRQIIANAPHCIGWQFFPSKPPKEWDGIWKMKNEFGKRILINSSNWEYILYQFEDRTFDIDILIDYVDGDLQTCYLAIDIALTGYLGEEEFMRLIKNIKILTELTDELADKLTRLKFLKKQIKQIIIG